MKYANLRRVIMKGTEKQIKYANDLRNKRISEIQIWLDGDYRTKKNRIKKNKNTDRVDKSIKIKELEIEILKSYDGDAGKMIDVIKNQAWNSVLYKKLWDEILGNKKEEWDSF